MKIFKLLIFSLIYFPLTLGLLFFSFVYMRSDQDLSLTNTEQNNFSFAPYVYALPDFDTQPKLIAPYQDIRIETLKLFFTAYNSPLSQQAEELVRQADVYGLDYALIPAISMQESGGCKVTPPDSNNCWGFGIYGTKIVNFLSYQTAIAQVAKTIKEIYVKKGLTNPTLLEDRWVPSSQGKWSYAVNYFIGQIRKIEKTIAAS